MRCSPAREASRWRGYTRGGGPCSEEGLEDLGRELDEAAEEGQEAVRKLREGDE
jgi:hypothetical protein